MKKTLSRWGQRFGLGRAIGLLLLLVFLGIRIWDPPPLQELRLRSFDLYQVLHPRAIDPTRRDRRYRREQSTGLRPVALGADPCRRADQPADLDGGRDYRVRRGIC